LPADLGARFNGACPAMSGTTCTGLGGSVIEVLAGVNRYFDRFVAM
jgi:hypothetical protein